MKKAEEKRLPSFFGLGPVLIRLRHAAKEINPASAFWRSCVFSKGMLYSTVRVRPPGGMHSGMPSAPAGLSCAVMSPQPGAGGLTAEKENAGDAYG